MKDGEENNAVTVANHVIKYGAWLLGLIIVLYFLSRHLFPFIQSLF